MFASDPRRTSRFEAVVLPSLPAAYNLARWITHNAADAEDVVQEACLRAFKFFDGYRGGDARAWLLQIVRNTAHTWLTNARSSERLTMTDEQLESSTAFDARWTLGNDKSSDPAESALDEAAARQLRAAIAQLPVDYREVLILREFEDLPYRTIAEVTSIPIGTVMSRLSRARDLLAASMLAMGEQR